MKIVMAQIKDFELCRGEVGEGSGDSVFEYVEFYEVGKSCYLPGYGSFEFVDLHSDSLEFGECA